MKGISGQTMSRELHDIGYRMLSGRPRHRANSSGAQFRNRVTLST